MHAVSTNQIADILHFNDKVSYYAYNSCAQGYEYSQNPVVITFLTFKEFKFKKLLFESLLKTHYNL